MAAASPTWSTTGSPHKTTLVGIGIEAGCRDRVGNMTKPPLQEIDEVLLLLTGILIPPVVVAGLHHHLHARPLPRPRLAEANIDCLRTVTIHLCANTVHRGETMVSIVYGTSSGKGMMRGIETTILTDDMTMMTTHEGMNGIILLGVTEDIMQIMMIGIGDRG